MKSKNITQKKQKSAKKAPKNIAKTIIANYTKWNLICLVAICVCYAIAYLFLLQKPDIYHKFFEGFLVDLFSNKGEEYLTDHSYILILPAFIAVSVFNAFVFSLTTLILLNKTYKSLDSFSDDTKDISSFSKAYSDIEIKLKDIKLQMLETRQEAIQSENKKNDLIMYLAHDLKTPLTSVIGYLTLLDECPEIPTSQRAKFTDIALNKAYRLEQLISEFFEITRFNIKTIDLQKNRVDIKMMIEQIADEFYPMLNDRGLRVTIDIPEPIIMFADSDKIARVFDNLLKNAVNYSYENTTIIVGARIRNEKVVIKFRNKSDEIPEEKLKRLFDKFYRVDSSRGTSTGGSGLGLAIAKQIAELHGGTIKAKSSPEHTDFTVVLPYVNAQITETDEQIDFE